MSRGYDTFSPLSTKNLVKLLILVTFLFSCFGNAIYILFHIPLPHLILTVRRKPAPVSLDVLWKDANLFLYVCFQVYSLWVMGLILCNFQSACLGKFRDIINHMGVLQLNNFLLFWWSQLLQISPSFMFRTGNLIPARITFANASCQLILYQHCRSKV